MNWERGSVHLAKALVLVTLGCGSLARAADGKEPWAGPARATWVQEAADRAFSWYSDEVALRELPELFASPLPSQGFIRKTDLPPDVSRELQIVAHHRQPTPILSEDGAVTTVPVEVIVHPSPRPIVLVLTSDEPVVFEVRADDGARIDSVRYVCPNECAVRVPLGGAFAAELRKAVSPGHVLLYNYAPWRNHSGLDPRLQWISEQLELPVVGAQGPNESGRYHVPIDLDRAVLLDISAAHRLGRRRRSVPAPEPFLLVRDGTVVSLGGEGTSTTVARPSRVIRAVTRVTPACDYFGLGLGELIRFDAKTWATNVIQPSPDLPRLGWNGGIAYDERSSAVVVTRASPKGVCHLYFPSSGKWHTIQADVGLVALAYSPHHGALYGLQMESGAGLLVQLAPDLKVVEMTELPKGLFRPSPPAPVQMAAAGDRLVVCVEGSSCFVIESRSGDVRLLAAGDAG